MKEQTRIPKYVRRWALYHIQLIGVFANPTADIQDPGECVTNVVELNANCSQTNDSLDEQIETNNDTTLDNGLSPLKISQVMAMYNDFECREEDEKTKSIQKDDSLSEQPIRSKMFGCPGPPLTSLMYDFDELVLESTEPLPPGRLKFEKETQVNSEQTSFNDSGLPSMSTLSQDDMTLDAEMGRPPRITAAGRALQRQQQERQAVDDQEVKHRLRQPENLSIDRANVSNRVSLNQEMKQDSPQRKSEEDIMDFIKQLAKESNKPAPTVKLFDAAILYDKNDYEDVKIFMSEVQMIAKKELQEDIRVELFDSEEFAQSQVMVVADIVERCSVVFVYITSNSNTDFFNFFCDEAVGMSRLGLNNLGDQRGFQMKDRRWMLKPVHTKPIKNRFYKTPVGLLTLAGVEWYDWPQSYVRDRIKSILNTAIIRRKTAESEKNITLSYEHAFPNKDDTFQRNDRASSFPQFQPTRISRSRNESVDAFSLHLTQQRVLSHEGFPQHTPIPTLNVIPPHFTQIPSHYLNHANYAQHSFSRQSQMVNQQEQYFNQGHQFPQYGVSQGNQYAPNPYPSHRIFSPPPLLQPDYGPPPPYQSSIMQDQLSCMYPYDYQKVFGQRGHPVVTPASHISTRPHSEKVFGQFQNQYSTRSDHKKRSWDHHQKTNGPSRYPDTEDSVRHNSAAFGSLMRDQKDDTPPSHELNVVSRLTGKLITNPNLSNDDLEIDTGEKPGKIPDRSRYDKEKSREGIIDTSDDSDSSSYDDDEGADIGNLFSGKGKIVNIIGSGVVQLGKHNQAVERYKTKRVYQGIPKGKFGEKSYNKEADSGMASCVTERLVQIQRSCRRQSEFAGSAENRITDEEPGNSNVAKLGQSSARGSNQRPDYNYVDQNYPSSMKRNQSKPIEDKHTLPASNSGDIVNIGIQPHNRQNNSHTLSNSDAQTSILLNNLDQGRNLSQSRNETLQTKTYHNEATHRQQRNHEHVSHTDNFRLSHVDNFSIHKISSPGQEFDDAERLISIDDNTFEPAENEILNDEELFVADSSNTGVQDQAKFLFSSFRTSPFSKPSLISSSVNTEEVASEKDDLD